MLILLDIGNTRSKYVIVENTQRSVIYYCDNGDLNEEWLTVNFSKASELILANVNNDKFTVLIESWASNSSIKFQHLQTQNQQFELICAYSEPSQLGIDRWLAMLGTSFLFPYKACIVIDAGTATTIDVISPKGKHLGGWIFPGINMLYQSLVGQTQKIIADKSSTPSMALGKNTSECVNNGTWAITVGAIELQLKNMKQQYTDVEVILTGGNCTKISSMLNDTHHIIDDLIFIGMQRFCL
ncbi:type III pantothenate kinase [Thalassotalea profundi]|uniref:Type III pantothenate kinase n=1 Tax=Thalassotalea profundi TaxID=2036687 RepID=A0ABQ3J4S3_9GAMM|nr:type III pantothenate kinase [Thalassotalea profundi]GHF02579.1 type III pantothenate kinase [Thalassotalea profundi]